MKKFSVSLEENFRNCRDKSKTLMSHRWVMIIELFPINNKYYQRNNRCKYIGKQNHSEREVSIFIKELILIFHVIQLLFKILICYIWTLAPWYRYRIFLPIIPYLHQTTRSMGIRTTFINNIKLLYRRMTFLKLNSFQIL